MTKHTTKISKLQVKKVLGLKLAEAFRRLGELDRAIRVEQCGTYLEFSQVQDGESMLTAANFCRERLCPTCSWRRSVRIFSNTSRILDCVEEIDKDCKFLFLTLTIKNCAADELAATLDGMSAAFHRLKNNRAWKSRVKGCIRTLEVTINHEDGTFHPHYHLILAVSKSYADKDSKIYWTQEQWAEAWRKSARLDYVPHVWIETVKGRRQGIEEVSKYMAKDSDYILPDNPEETDRVVSILMRDMMGRRLIGYSGVFLAAQRALKLESPEDGPLTDKLRGDIVVAVKKYHWNSGLCRYVQGERKDV